MLMNYHAGEDSWQQEDSGQQRDQTSQSWRKSTLNSHWKDYAKAEAPIFWPPDAKSQLTGKDSNAGREWREEKKGAAEEEMVK